MEKEIRRRMEAGEPLPPGFTALPEGEVPPPGMVPAGVTARPNGQPAAPPDDLTQFNPVRKDDPNTLTLLRNSSKCPIPDEGARLQKNIQAVLGIPNKDVDNDEIELILCRGIATSLRINTHCEAQKSERVAADLTQDEALADMTTRMQALTDEADQLNQKLQKTVDEARTIIKERWNLAVKKFGLNPAKYIYCFNEEDTQILELRVDCSSCKGPAKVRKSRQEGEELLQRVANAQKQTALKSVGLDNSEPEEEKKTDE
jgi:hypothetical protein